MQIASVPQNALKLGKNCYCIHELSTKTVYTRFFDAPSLKWPQPLFAKTAMKKTTVALTNHFKQGQIHYTTDGNPPNTMSAIYNEKNPLVFTQHTPLKAQYFENGKR